MNHLLLVSYKLNENKYLFLFTNSVFMVSLVIKRQRSLTNNKPNKKMNKAKTISNHPAVKDYSIIDWGDGNQHSVLLKDGYYFTGIYFSDGDRQEADFDTVKDFMNAKPVKTS